MYQHLVDLEAAHQVLVLHITLAVVQDKMEQQILAAVQVVQTFLLHRVTVDLAYVLCAS